MARFKSSGFSTRSFNGYRQFNSGSGWKFTHRTVAQKEFDSIPSGSHVHHINGIKTDNRPSNLTIMSASEHARLHNSNK